MEPAASASDYLHNASLFYRTGKHNTYEVMIYKELEAIDLGEL
jgi:hypothetical protein